MKIESTKKFTPVTITLESQDELDLFTTIFENVGGNVPVKVVGSTSTIPNHLRDAGGDGNRFKAVGTNCGSLYIEDDY